MAEGLLSRMREVTPYLLYIILTATLGPLQFGYHLAELNSPQAVLTCEAKASSFRFFRAPASSSKLPQCIPMNPTEFGTVSSIFTLGGLVGALAAGPTSSSYGRSLVMRISSLFSIIGPILEAPAPNIACLAIGRFLSGLGAGSAVVVAPMYISEVAPPREKGMFGALTQVMTNLGIFITQLLGYFLSHGQMWRLILAVAGFIAIGQFVGLLAVPESPGWMAAHGRGEKAANVLRRIRGEDYNIRDELDGQDSVIAAEEEGLLTQNEPSTPRARPNPKATKAHMGYLEVLRSPQTRPAVVAVIGVMIAQQFSGINAIVMYSVSILRSIMPTNAALIGVFITILNLVVTLLCAPLADKLGRKACLLLSLGGMGVCSLVLGLSLMLKVNILSAIATLLFVAAFATGLGPVPFILAAELVGPEAVGPVQSYSLAVNWIATFFVAQFFPLLNELLPNGKVYFVFAALSLVFWVYIYVLVPETKGKKDADEVWGRERRVD